MYVIFVEGPDDYNYFSKCFNGENYQIFSYANTKAEKVCKFINSINCIPNGNYLFFADSDGKTEEQKKTRLLEIYPQLHPEKIFIVKFEIESWYLAGANESYCEKMKFARYIHNTDLVTKEHFNSLLPLHKYTRLEIMLDILNNYDEVVANKRNQSCSNFLHKKEELIYAV